MARKERRRAENVKATMETTATIIREVQMSLKTYHGIVKIEDTEYYFSATKGLMPVVFGHKDPVHASKELARTLNNRLLKESDNKTMFVNLATIDNTKKYSDENNLIIKTAYGYTGYMKAAKGFRAVNVRYDEKPYSCAVETLIKDLDRPGKKSFRTMEGQGQKIREMIPELHRMINILNSSPDPQPEEKKRTRKRRERKSNIEAGDKTPVSNNTENKIEEKEVIKDNNNTVSTEKEMEVVSNKEIETQDKIEKEEVVNETNESTVEKDNTLENGDTVETERKSARRVRNKAGRTRKQRDRVNTVNPSTEDMVKLAKIIIDLGLRSSDVDLALVRASECSAAQWLEEIKQEQPSNEELCEAFRHTYNVLFTAANCSFVKQMIKERAFKGLVPEDLF